MIFSMTMRHWAELAISPRQIYRQWKKRSQLRQDLSRMLADPYLLDDVGFNRDSAEIEVSRSPWHPISNLRMPPRLLPR
ncbi:hypothetical protein [Oryzibacter oryziterrae]|uniref:hypothetical protein n=1 Tax=Oryzibacter oryziterrae TaxID=2766474 RepID=UPI001F3E7FE2|nr:hypothetical protein [Oryzibacter oryziterrae]